MTKIDIISGFLGAGKTTFIKKMLDEAFQARRSSSLRMSSARWESTAVS